ncbi:hypothetical protein [Piscinibacter gummiphilus]|uniref:DUF4124 domain-containing protein n=1 Tax=Piscinibacter gummiphilus TaxID=946333 RepID=A0ABZ0CWC7_9BURK|nr:hypothetical protein [Piscinibacter gummiphilus]WOB09203.1 hypothetical protein RXV79_03875 [Piscinibacter gummiphilus]
MRTVLLLIAAALTSASVHAQTVYRCGPEGRSYSQTPCAQGRAIEVNDERSTQQRREALDVAERDRALADSLEEDRVTREARPRAGMAKIDGRIGFARVAHAEAAKKTVKSKKKPKASQHADRYKAVSAPRS